MNKLYNTLFFTSFVNFLTASIVITSGLRSYYVVVVVVVVVLLLLGSNAKCDVIRHICATGRKGT